MRVEVGGHVEAVLLSVHVVMPLGRWTGLRPCLGQERERPEMVAEAENWLVRACF
jgi:hypothetical protein